MSRPRLPVSGPRLDDDGLCICCSLVPTSCGRQAEQRLDAEHRAETKRLAALPGATFAQWPGTCGVCGETFDKGEPIQAISRFGRHRDAIDRSGSPWRGLVCCGPKP